MKYLVTDLDGTLLNKDFEWDEFLDKALKKLLNNECELVIATGRTLHGVKKSKALWEAPIYLIVMNGAMILDKERNVIFTKALPKDVVKSLLDILKEENLEFITSDGILCMLSKEEYINEYSKWDIWRKKVLNKKDSGYYDEYLNQFVFSVNEEDILQKEILKINGLQLDNQRYQTLLCKLDKLKDKIINNPFADNVIEITNPGITKDKAVFFLKDIFGWKQEDIYVFGDGGNDIEMLNSFINSYAPQNASIEAKKAAKSIIASNEEYGVINKMLELMCSN